MDNVLPNLHLDLLYAAAESIYQNTEYTCNTGNGEYREFRQDPPYLSRQTEETEPFSYTNTSSTLSSLGRSQMNQWKILEPDLHKHPRSQGSLDVAHNFLRKLRGPNED